LLLVIAAFCEGLYSTRKQKERSDERLFRALRSLKGREVVEKAPLRIPLPGLQEFARIRVGLRCKSGEYLFLALTI
jgi:hypothetical protein